MPHYLEPIADSMFTKEGKYTRGLMILDSCAIFCNQNHHGIHHVIVWYQLGRIPSLKLKAGKEKLQNLLEKSAPHVLGSFQGSQRLKSI